MVTLGRPYEGGSALTADGYIQNDAQLIRMATPSNMETFCGINSLCTWRSSERDFDFYSQSLGSTIMSGQWYTLSFYARGSGSINTYVYDYGGRVLSDASADMPMADGVKEKTFDTGGSHTWPLTSEWVRHIYTFRVRPDGSYTSPLLLFRATIGTSGDFIAINQVKLEVGKNASDWCLNEMDKKAVSLPDWLKAFNGYTMSGDNYIASGNAFFGRKEIDNTYTGCMMSSNGLQIGGNTVVGLYALDHNILKVAIDPVHQQYYFKGKVYADEGEFKGTIKADKGYFNGVVTGSVRNSTTIIDKSNYSYYTEDLNGGGIGLRFDRTDSIIYLNFNDGENKFTFEEMIFYLIPYSYSAESVSSCLALLGKTYIIYHKGLKKLKLKGKFLKSGEVSTVYETSITSAGSVVKLILQLDKNGVFYWEYVAVVSIPNIPTISSGAMPNKNGALMFGPPETVPPVIKPEPLAE